MATDWLAAQPSANQKRCYKIAVRSRVLNRDIFRDRQLQVRWSYHLRRIKAHSDVTESGQK